MKLDIEKFDRSVNFSLWQVKMKVTLKQNGVQNAIDGVDKMPERMTQRDRKRLTQWHYRQFNFAFQMKC